MRLAALACVVSQLLVACGDDGVDLAVDLRTDMVPGVEFVGVRTTIAGAPVERNAARGEDFVGGLRVAEREGLSAGTYGVRVELLDLDGRVVVERNIQLDLRESFGLTVVITRSCLAVECPAIGGDPALTTCYAGRCVDPTCGADGGTCPPPECTSDGDCSAAATCAAARCDEGACLSVADDTSCGAAEYCDPDDGCAAVPGGDAGAVDAMMDAPPDAGPDTAVDSGGDAGLPPVITQITAGSAHTCALDDMGLVYCWGENEVGQVGFPAMGTDPDVPYELLGVGPGILALAAGSSHTCALEPTGRVVCWGNNESRQLGSAVGASSTSPVPVPGIVASFLFAGGSHTCTIDDAFDATCWGANAVGQLGRGTATPAEPPGLVAFAGDFVGLALGAGHTCGVDDGGRVHCWGDGADGQLGMGAVTSSTSSPLEVTAVPVSMGGEWRLFANYDRTCVTRLGAQPLCWGDNAFGGLGTGDTMNRDTPVPVSSATNVLGFGIGSGHTCAANTEGSVRCAGAGSFGQLGDGTVPDARPSFGPVGVTDVAELAGGEEFTCARTTSGRVFCWGRNSSGQLGNGSTTDSIVPVMVRFP